MPRDIAPEEHHISHRSCGKTFYLPSLFHLAPTTDKTVPLSIRDVIRAKNILEVYGVQGLEKHSQGYIMLNNYPIKSVLITGRLLSYTYKNFDQGSYRNPNNFFLFTLDDCSGDSLSICVKVLQADLSYRVSEIREGLILEVTGTVAYIQDYERQIIGKTVEILGNHHHFHIEMDCWSRVLETRQLLMKPWKYTPDEPAKCTGVNREPQFLRRDYDQRMQKTSLNLAPGTESQIGNQVEQCNSIRPYDLPLVDSFVVHKSPIPRSDLGVVEIIDLTEEGSSDWCSSKPTFSIPRLPRLRTFSQNRSDTSVGGDTDVDVVDLTSFDELGGDSQDSVVLIS